MKWALWGAALCLFACSKSGGSDGAPAASASAKTTAGAPIELGQTVPLSGPASAFGNIGKAEVAYFAMVNDRGAGDSQDL